MKSKVATLTSHPTSSHAAPKELVFSCRSILVTFLLTIIAQMLCTNIGKLTPRNATPISKRPGQDCILTDRSISNQLVQKEDCSKTLGATLDELKTSSWMGAKILFAEAGKKKKKEKSEVVVISVNGGSGKSHGGGMYPIYIPTCGGGHMGGYGRRRKRAAPGPIYYSW